MGILANGRSILLGGRSIQFLLWGGIFLLLLWATRALIFILQMIVLHKKAIKTWARLRHLLLREVKIGDNFLRRITPHLIASPLAVYRLRTALERIPRTTSPLECSQLYGQLNKNFQQLLQILETLEDPQLLSSLQEAHKEWLNLQKNVQKISKTYNQYIAQYNRLRMALPLRWILPPLGIPPLEYFPIEEETLEGSSA